MKQARDEVYRTRLGTLAAGGMSYARRFLPEVLQPLGKVLGTMRAILTTAYEAFEDSFDGSGMLSVFEELRGCLVDLERIAKGLVQVEPPILNLRLNTDVAMEFDERAYEGG